MQAQISDAQGFPCATVMCLMTAIGPSRGIWQPSLGLLSKAKPTCFAGREHYGS